MTEPPVRVQLLGPVRAWRAGAEVPLRGVYGRTVLAQLTLARGTAVGIDVLTDALWGDRPPPKASGDIHAVVSRLRRALGTRTIETTPGGYRLTARVRTDVAELETALDELDETDPESAADRLRDLISAWEGPPLDGIAATLRSEPDRTMLRELQLHARDRLYELLLNVGRAEEVVPGLQRHAEAAPLRERTQILLARALTGAGRNAEALRVISQYRSALLEESGLESSAEMAELERTILGHDTAPMPPRTPVVSRRRIPTKSTALDTPFVRGDVEHRTFGACVEPPRYPPRQRARRPPGRVIGREAELGAIARLFHGVAEGPVVVALEGEPGIGKTTVWTEGVELAREQGFAVLSCRPSVSEVRLSHAGLTDLLSHVRPEVFGRLPRPQRRAIDSALLRGTEEYPAPDPRTVAAGFLSVLDGLASTAPVLIAIDDIQWLDEPTARVLEFAVRRGSGPIATLTARRVESRGSTRAELCPLDPNRRQVLDLGPLSAGSLHLVLEQRTDRAFPRHLLSRIAQTSGGNPFFALELARSIDPGSPGVMALPENLRSLIAERLAALAAPVRQVLLVASALAKPSIGLIQRMHEGTDVVELLGAAEDAGIVVLSRGSARFTHPVFAIGAYSEAPPTARRAVHRRLSGLVGDIEERARHLALAAIGPDDETVTALDAAAAHARRRGAPTTAAELLDLAIGLGADDPGLRVRAADDFYFGDDPTRARSLLETTIAELGPGRLRAVALARLGMIRYQLDGSAEAAGLLEQAAGEVGPDVDLRCSIALTAAWVLFNSGRGHDALAHAARAVEDAERLGDEGQLAEALASKVIVAFLLGQGIDNAALGRALALEDPGRRTVVNQPSHIAAFIYWWTHRLDEARAAFAAVRQRCIDHGMESELLFVSTHAIPIACAAGDVAGAEELLDEVVERAHLVRTDYALAHAHLVRGQFWAWVGCVDEARAAATEALAVFGRGSFLTHRLLAYQALGMAELSIGDIGAAVETLAPAARSAVSMGFGEPAAVPFLADAAEALIAVGRVDEAQPMLRLLEASGRRSDRLWAQAVGARCRALLLAAAGRHTEAAEAFHRAEVAHDRVPQLRYDRGRTLLALGQYQRRRNQHRDADHSLNEAARLFDEVGTAQWARNAREELGQW